MPPCSTRATPSASSPRRLRSTSSTRPTSAPTAATSSATPTNGRATATRATSRSPHIALRQWADLLIVAPLDANTLAKFALGLSDNLLTSLFRAWDFSSPVILAPAMNTLMWESPVTRRHLKTLLEDRGDGLHPSSWTLTEADAVFARHAPGIVLIPPQSKRLACGDLGIGAMAEVATIAEVVRARMA